MALAEAGLTSASSVKSPGPDKQPLNLNVFGGKALQLPNINLPIVKNGPGQPGLLDIGGAVGALNSYAAAQAAAGKAAAGAITDSGSIDPSAAQDPSKNINAKIDLRVLLDQLGLDTAHQLISTAEVDANALSSSINATKKPITAADTSYAFADAHARLQLPPVAALTGLLTSGLDQLKTPINAVIGDTGALNTALKAALAALNVDLVVASLKTTGSTVSITGTDAVVAALAASLPTKIVSKNGGVTLDLTTGLADVDVAKIYNATGGAKDLNGLPPNTDVLDDKMVEALVNGVADVADAVIEKLNTGLKDALLNNLKLTIDLAAKVDLVGGVASANTSINITGTLAQFTGVTGAGDPTITATDLSIKPPLLPPVNIPAGTIVNALKPVLLTALKTVLGTAIDGLNTTLTANPGPIQAIVEPIVKAAGDALSPAFQAIKKVARLIINDQPTLDGRPADIASPTAYSVRALTLVLFPGGLPGFPTPPAPGGGQVPDPRDGLARVSISSSTADFGAAAAAPALAVNPASVPAGGKTSVTGTGWATGTPVSVQLKDPSGANVGAPVSVTPNADGSLPATDLPVPAGSAAGAYTVVGTQGTTPPVSTPLTVTAAATPTIKADPTSVPAGGKTSVTGTGWDPASPVSVQLKDAAGANVGSPVSITPGADGSLPATDLPVPAGTKAGDYTVVGTQGSNTQTAPLTVTDAAAPTIKADPASVPAGTKTSVTGTGWTPGTPVSVQLTDPAGAAVGTPVSITPAADGSLPATDLPVPATATPGAYTVVGTQGTAKQSAPLTVTAAVVPTIKANPTSVPAGGKTSVTGTGWDPASPVSVQLKDAAGANVGSPVSITPGADGSLPATDLPVPAGTKAGDYTVVGTQGSNTQTAPLTVTDAAAPTIKADPASVPAGTKTSVTGTGWTPGTPVSVQLTDPAGAAVGTPVSITPAADGSLPATDLPVPATATPGAYTVVGTQGSNTQSAPLTVTAAVNPALKADPTSVPAGKKTSITGTGWDPAQPVKLQLTDPAGQPVGNPVTVTPTADGALPATDLPVPATAVPGKDTVVGTQGTDTTSTPLTVTAAVNPALKVDPTSVPAGGKTSVTGTGWDPAQPVKVQLTDKDGKPVGDPVNVTPAADGSLPATDLPVPATATPGDYTVVGTQGTDTTSTPLTVTAATTPALTVNPTSVPAGKKTSVTGTGWTPGTPVSVQLKDPSGANVGAPVSITPAADGALPATDLPVPADAKPGNDTVVGTQGATTTSTPLTVTPADGTASSNTNASASASASANADSKANAAAQAAAQAAANADATSTASAAANTAANAAAKSAANANATANASADATSAANAQAQAAATAAANSAAQSDTNATASAAATANANAASKAAATANSSTNASAAAAANANATANANANASASAAASANADSKANAAAQAAAQAAANADATSTASAAANTAANAAAKSAATANATANASADATSAANASAQAAATAAANSAAQSDSNAKASAAANANASAAASAASNANSSNNASSAAAANASSNADGNASGIKVTIDRNLVNKGANVVLKVTGTGFKATEKVAGVLFSEQSPLGSQVADANGQVVFTFNSQNLELGDHTVTLTSTVDAAKTGSVSFKVVPAGAGNVNASGSSNGSGDGLANTGSNDPTSIFVGAGIALLLGAALVSIAVSRKRRGTEIGS